MMSILLLSMTLRWTKLPLHWIPHSEIICPMALRMILSQLAFDSGLLFFLIQVFF